MKHILTLFIALFVSTSIGWGQIISQYVETESGSVPKGIEIWNNTAATINFSAGNALTIEQGTNGAAPTTVVTISSGSLASGAVMVIGTSTGGLTPDHVFNFTFNGDDALVVKLAGTTTDVFGTPGVDPGSAWSGSGVSTANQNIQLKDGITTGDTDGWTDPSARFETVSTTPSGVGGTAGFGTAPAGATTVTIANTGSPAAGDIVQGSTRVTLFGFALTPSSSVDFTSVSITTAGTATSDDLSNFRLIHDENGNGVWELMSESEVKFIGSLSETLTFASFSIPQTAITSVRRYLLIADVAEDATIGATFTASIAAASDVITTGDETGTAIGNQMSVISDSTPVITPSVSSLGNFGDVAFGSISNVSSFTVSADNLMGSVTLQAPEHFQISQSPDLNFGSEIVLAQTDGNLSGEPVTIYARMSPASVSGLVLGNISLSSTGATTATVGVSGFILAGQPSTSASGLSFTSVSATGFTINWTRGDGQQILVLVKSGSAVDADPADKSTYSANAAFGSGSQLGTGNYAVYKGTGTSVAVSGLTAGVTYHVEAFEFNLGAEGTENYEAAGLAGSQETDSYPPLNAITPEDFDEYRIGLWIGDTGSYGRLTDGTVPSGLVSTDGGFIGSNSSVGNSTLLTSSSENRTWAFSIATTDFDPSTSNYIAVVLMSDVSFTGSVNTASFNGYFLKLGASGSADNIELWLSTGGTKTKMGDYTAIGSFGLGALENGLNLLVVRSNAGAFSVYYSTGFSWASQPTADGGTITDNTHTSSSYFGFGTVFANPSTSRRIYMDNIRLGIPTLTGTQGWRLLSSPVAGTYADLLGPIWTQGATGADVSNGTPNVYTHLSGDSTYTAVTNLTAALPAGRGIAVYVYGDDDYDGAGSASWPKTLSVTGTENADGTTFTPASWTAGDEYAIAGNPFASTIDWDAVNKGADVGESVWVWNTGASAYDAWNGTAGDLTDGLITPFQGFWMQYSGADRTLTFNDLDKTTGGTFRGKSADQPFVLALRGSSGEKRHTAWLEFSETGEWGRDAKDAVSFVPMATSFVHMGSISDGVKYDINHLPLIEERAEIPVALTATVGGTVTLSAAAFNLPEGWMASLTDRETGVTHTLSADWSATVETALAKDASVDPLTFDGRPVTQAADEVTRFTLVIDPGTSTSTPDAGRETPDAIALHGAYPNPFNPSTVVRYTLDAGRQTSLKVYDILGREVAVLVNGTLPAGSHTAAFDASNLTSGVYIVRLEAGGMSMTKRITLLK
jgi:hypothetical protein